MKTKVTYKNVKHSVAVDKKLDSHTSKLAKYWPRGFDAKWFCDYKEGEYFVELHVSGPHGSYHAKAKEVNMYKAFDHVHERMEKQLDKQKGKIKAKHHKRKSPDYIPDSEEAWTEYDEDYYADVG